LTILLLRSLVYTSSLAAKVSKISRQVLLLKIEFILSKEEEALFLSLEFKIQSKPMRKKIINISELLAK